MTNNRKTPLTPLRTALALALLGLTAGPAAADDMKALKAEIEALKGRLESMEKSRAEASASAGALHSAKTDMDLRVGGYVQLNAIRDLGANVAANGSRDFFFAPDIPLSGSAEAGREGKTFFSARTSRLYFQAQKPSPYGNVKAHIEADFFTGEGSEAQANSARFRLRHAYAEVGNWLAGQYWSTFVDVNSMADVLDFGGPTGQVFARQPQIRYTLPIGDGQTMALALENPDNSSVANHHTSLPDFIAKYVRSGDWGHLSLAGVVRRLESDDGFGDEAARTVTGFSLAGSFNVFGGDSVVYQLNVGRGIGRYLSDAGGETAVLSRDNIVLQPAIGAYLGYQHPWRANLRSALVVGRTWFDNDSLRDTAGFDANATNRRLTTAHANLIWTPIGQVDVGLEYIHGKREVESGASGIGRRVMLGMVTRF